jgi:hypothetical protein
LAFLRNSSNSLMAFDNSSIDEDILEWFYYLNLFNNLMNEIN